LSANGSEASPVPIMRPWLGVEEQQAAVAAIASGWVAQGPRVAAFEQAMAARLGAAHAVAVSSCTAGLHLALVVLGIGASDEVVVPSLSFIATANAPRYVGATPVFADVDEVTQNLTPDTIAAVLTERTRAVILVHQAGMPADVRAVHALCDPLGIAVVEDAACAIGATIDGAPVGSHSDLVTFSFHPRKLLTTGEGGMVLTTNADWAQRLRRLREHGMSASAADRHTSGVPVVERYLETGFNYRMTDVQAAIGLVQLERLDPLIARRRSLADRYADRLTAIPGLGLPADPPHGTSNYQSYCVRLPDSSNISRNELMGAMQRAGISTRRGIMAAHLEPAYAGHPHTPLPVTERLTASSIILPLFHEMTESEHDRVVDALTAALVVNAEPGSR
jgi:dTDP-4-amino-4,6-dideoxygalactose transaminase